MSLAEQVCSDYYRVLVQNLGLYSFRVLVRQTDLLVSCEKDLAEQAGRSVQTHRRQVEQYIAQNPFFARAMTPIPEDPQAPPIVKAMIEAATAAGVGPMAAVAGAIAEFVGRDLMPQSSEVIIENGGDLFICSQRKRDVVILAEKSSLQCLTFSLEPSGQPQGVCTSSGVLGHSLSFGKADAVTVIAPSAVLADAAATAICNTVKTPADIKPAIAMGQRMGAQGVIVLTQEHLGVWGCPELKG